MWELECKEGEHQRINVFKLWCWKRLLRIPWTARRSIQSVLKEINPEYSLEGLMLMLKRQYFGHLIWRTDSLEKNPDAGKDWGQEEKGTTEDEMVGWHHQLIGHGFRQTPRDGEGQGGLACCSLWGHEELDTAWQPNNNPLGWRRMVRKLEPFLHGVTSEVRVGECYQIIDICIMIHNL